MTFWWTDERIEELKRLAPNHTGTEIARMMGATSRNVIIGKLHRLKLALNPDRPQGQARPKIKRAKLYNPNARAASVQPLIRRRGEGDPLVIPDYCRPGAPAEPACEPVPETALALADLTQDACRWPLWGGATPSNERRFCGGMAIEGLPYCSHHARIAYTGQEWATLPMRRAG